MAEPGLLLAWCNGEPQLRTMRLPLHQAFELGRTLVPDDVRTSAQHALIHARGDDFVVTRVATRNGVYVDGEEIELQGVAWDRAVIRTGSSLWLACRDITPFEALAPSRDPSTSEAPGAAVSPAAIGFVIRAIGRARTPALPIHHSIVERCLRAVWRDRAALISAIEAAIGRAVAAKADKLREEHLGPVTLLRATVPFATYFQRITGARPPFEIPARYHVHATTRIDGVPHETIISSEKRAPSLAQADLSDAVTKEPGYFMAGFGSHGSDDAAVYLARTTEQYRLFLRLPYGAGESCPNPKAERALAVARLERYAWLAETLPVAHVTLLDSMGIAHYELVRHDGRVVSCRPELFSLDDVDFLALAMEMD